MRCLNTQKYGFKIGPECYEFCIEHFDASLLKLFTVLTGPIEVVQEQIIGEEIILFNIRTRLEFWNFDDDEMLAQIEVIDNHLHLSIEGVWRNREQSSILQLSKNIMPFLEQRDGFIIKYFGVSNQKLDTGSFKNKVYGRFQGNLVKIPIDNMNVHIFPTSQQGILNMEIEIRYI